MWDVETIRAYIEERGIEHGLSPETRRTIFETVRCETAGTFDPSIQSGHYHAGIREESWGLSQIHLPDWPDVTKKQATDPEFALDFIVEKFAEGRPELWTCYRMRHS